MPLLRLPNETLAQIFGQVGSSFFREDLERLTVCKHWFHFALPTLYQSISLSQETLWRLIASGVIRRSLLKDSLETLDLELIDGSEAFYPPVLPREDAQEPDTPSTPAPAEPPGDNPHQAWIDSLNEDLARLAALVQQSRRLRTLRVQAWRSTRPRALETPGNYLSLPKMHALLSVENLSVLMLDLSAGFSASSEEQEERHHICPVIGAHLRTLRTLHLRLRTICADVLKPLHSGDKLRLNTVVVNLSLMMNLPGVTASNHSTRCGSVSGGLPRLKADMQEQAEALATRMMSPRTVRILTHSHPFFEPRSFDVLTGKTMALKTGMAWDDDGSTVEEEDSGPESDLLDEDFNGFLNDDD